MRIIFLCIIFILNAFSVKGESLPNCKEVAFKLLGLSLATINLFISIFIVIISILFIKNEKNK